MEALRAARRDLPPDYHQVAEIDLAQHLGLALALNLAALVLFGLVAALLGLLLWLGRPGLLEQSLQSLDALGWGLTLLAVLVVMLVVHELVHGLFFWLVSGARPSFGIGWGYAYAAAPQWYIARGPYQMIGLAPLIGIGLACLVLMALGGPLVALAAALTAALNTSGAVGDMWIVAQVARRSPDCLVNDRGHSVRLYEPAGERG